MAARIVLPISPKKEMREMNEDQKSDFIKSQ